jgi:hypothetical protein
VKLQASHDWASVSLDANIKTNKGEQRRNLRNLRYGSEYLAIAGTRISNMVIHRFSLPLVHPLSFDAAIARYFC